MTAYRAYLEAIRQDRVLGLALLFLNITLVCVGFVMQRKSVLSSETIAVEKRTPMYRRPLWLAGVALYIGGCVPDVLACAMVPQVLYCTVGCFRLALMAILGHVVLAEQLTRRGVVGIAVCTLGATLCVAYGPGSDANLNVDASAANHPKIVAYVVMVAVLLAAFFVVVHGDDRGFISPSNALFKFALPFTTVLAAALQKVFNRELGLIKTPENIFHDRLWLFMMGSMAYLALVDFYLNLRAAQRMSVQVYVPLGFAFNITLMCFQGMVIFDELHNMTASSCVLTLVGIALVLSGAVMIQTDATDTLQKTNAKNP